MPHRHNCPHQRSHSNHFVSKISLHDHFSAFPTKNSILMSIHIQSVPVLDQYRPNDLALEEALDALDPLRHFFKSLDETDSPSKADALIPSQPSPAVKEIVQLSFGTHPFRTPILISLAVDASPGCGGIAWPAGQVNCSSPRNIYNSRVHWLPHALVSRSSLSTLRD